MPKTYYLIEWPESQRIMEHPDAWPIEVGSGNFAYIVPPEIWEQNKYKYYKSEIVDPCNRIPWDSKMSFEISNCNNKI